jgi:hypothetical protein
VTGASYLRGRQTRRTASGVPVSRTDYPETPGSPPNLAHQGDHLAALSLRRSDLLAEGLYYALTGERLDEETTVTEGHAHDAAATLLDWISLASWQAPGYSADSQGGDYVATDGAAVVLSLGLVAVPRGARYVWPRACVSVTDAKVAAVEVLAELAGDDAASLVLPSALVWSNAGVVADSHLARWREGTPLDLDRLTYADPDARLLVCRWSVRVATHGGATSARVHALSLGLGG